MSLTLVWKGGAEMHAKDAGQLLDLIGEVQWTPTGDRQAVKRLLSERAWTWSRAAVDPLAEDEAFLIACGMAGLFTIVRFAEPAPNRKP